MNKVFEIIRQAYNFRKTLRRCKNISSDSEEYKLGLFYKDEIEKLEKSQVNLLNIDKLIQDVKENLLRNQGKELMTEMLLNVQSFLETVKLFI
jgi:hypothetical protein